MRKTPTEYDIYSKFDIEQHKKKYINYFEAIILPNGKVEYAVPSHQEKLIRIGAEKYGVSRCKFIDMCPKDKYLDYEEWLCEATECVAVWFDFYRGKPNEAQKRTLNELYAANIVKPQNIDFASILERGKE